MPSFETVKNDIEDLMQIGRIVDMSEYNEPIIAVNTFTLEVHQFSDKSQTFELVRILDEENLIP